MKVYWPHIWTESIDLSHRVFVQQRCQRHLKLRSHHSQGKNLLLLQLAQPLGQSMYPLNFLKIKVYFFITKDLSVDIRPNQNHRWNTTTSKKCLNAKVLPSKDSVESTKCMFHPNKVCSWLILLFWIISKNEQELAPSVSVTLCDRNGMSYTIITPSQNEVPREQSNRLIGKNLFSNILLIDWSFEVITIVSGEHVKKERSESVTLSLLQFY